MIFNIDYRTQSDEELEGPTIAVQRRARLAQLEAAWAHRDQTLGDDFPTISDFYSGRHVFVTGATGFCGKVIVEKLLYACPDIGNIYLLIRPGRGGQTPADRLEDMIRLPLFDRLRKEMPTALNKMVAVGGDCMKEGLGLSAEDRRTLVEQVSVIIHSAASVRFTDPVSKAARMNTCSTIDIVQLAREMTRLKVLVHISTAYCNTAYSPTLEKTYPTEHDYKDVLKYIKLPDAHVLDVLGPKFFGFQPNTYVFTKALSEQVIRDAAKDLPIVIVRPTIVTCAVEEPLPGWMDSLSGMPMLWAVAFKGVMRVAHYAKKHFRFDLVPVDSVSRITILASWAIGTAQPLPCEPGDVQVVNITSAECKPTSLSTMEYVLHKLTYDKMVAYPNTIRYPHLYVTTNYLKYRVLMLLYHVLFGAIVDTLLVAFKQKPQLLSAYRKIECAEQALRYFKNEFPFGSDNMWQLLGMIHPRDRDHFHLPGLGRSYIDLSRDQVVGVGKYALREDLGGPEDILKNANKIHMLWWAEACLYFLLAALSLFIVGVRIMS